MFFEGRYKVECPQKWTLVSEDDNLSHRDFKEAENTQVGSPLGGVSLLVIELNLKYFMSTLRE